MTVKLVVLYTQPTDAAEFEKHYLEVHAPLVRALPGLAHFESGRVVAAADGGDVTYARLAELSFADQAAFEAAMGSAEGQATAADYQQIAPLGSRLFLTHFDD